MEIEELKNEKEWDDFIQTIPEATFYHTTKWKNIIEKSFHITPSYLMIKDRGEIVGACPGFVTSPFGLRIYSSLPNSDYGGPLFSSAYAIKGTNLLHNFLEAYCSDREISFAKICFLGNVPNQFLKIPFTRIDRSKGIAEIDLEVTPSESIWKKAFSKKTRQRIRLIEKDGFKLEEVKSKSSLKDFYSLYYGNLMHIHASAYPYEFFENMWNTLSQEEFHVWMLTGEQNLGGFASFVYRQRLYLIYVAINRERARSKYSIMRYFHFNAIRWSEEHGIRYCSLGSTPSDSTQFYYRQKLISGAKFLRQETALIPFSYNAKAFMIAREKAILAWKTIRDLVPVNFKTILECRLFQL